MLLTLLGTDFCKTHDTLDVGQESKRSQNQSKTGVVKAKGLTFCPFSQNIPHSDNPFLQRNSYLNGFYCIDNGEKI